jgi:hypothetical protein
VSDTARERADLIAGAQAAIVGARAATGRHRLPGMLMMADIVDALLAERDELKRDLHFSETMHQADLDQRIILEAALREIAKSDTKWENFVRVALAGVLVAEEEK